MIQKRERQRLVARLYFSSVSPGFRRSALARLRPTRASCGVREEMAHVIAYEAGDHGIGDDDQPTCYSRKLDELFEALGL